jgi:hypothetical protein
MLLAKVMPLSGRIARSKPQPVKARLVAAQRLACQIRMRPLPRLQPNAVADNRFPGEFTHSPVRSAPAVQPLPCECR